MTFLSVKVFDKTYTEICSTVSVSDDNRICDLVPYLGPLARKLPHEQNSEYPQVQSQALIVNNRIVGFLNSPDDLLLVVTTTINTSIQKLNHFLVLLNQAISKYGLNFSSGETGRSFQKICDDLINAIDELYPEASD